MIPSDFVESVCVFIYISISERVVHRLKLACSRRWLMSAPQKWSAIVVRELRLEGGRSCSFTGSFFFWWVSATRQITLPSVEQWGGEKRCQFPKPGQEHLINCKTCRDWKSLSSAHNSVLVPWGAADIDVNCLSLCGHSGHGSVNNVWRSTTRYWCHPE